VSFVGLATLWPQPPAGQRYQERAIAALPRRAGRFVSGAIGIAVCSSSPSTQGLAATRPRRPNLVPTIVFIRSGRHPVPVGDRRRRLPALQPVARAGPRGRWTANLRRHRRRARSPAALLAYPRNGARRWPAVITAVWPFPVGRSSSTFDRGGPQPDRDHGPGLRRDASWVAMSPLPGVEPLGSAAATASPSTSTCSRRHQAPRLRLSATIARRRAQAAGRGGAADAGQPSRWRC